MNNQEPDPKPDTVEQPANEGLDETACSAFRGPIEYHRGTIRVRVHVQREGTEYWARVVADPIRPESMPLAYGPTRELAIHAACEKASIPPNVKVMAHPLAWANVDRGVRVRIRWKHR